MCKRALETYAEGRALDRTTNKFSTYDLEFLSHYASRYIWWKTEEESLSMPYRLIAQIMNIGTLEDMNAIAEHFGDDLLRSVIRRAEIGQFRERSWTYWNYRLGLADVGYMPPIPKHRIPAETTST